MAHAASMFQNARGLPYPAPPGPARPRRTPPAPCSLSAGPALPRPQVLRLRRVFLLGNATVRRTSYRTFAARGGHTFTLAIVLLSHPVAWPVSHLRTCTRTGWFATDARGCSHPPAWPGIAPPRAAYRLTPATTVFVQLAACQLGECTLFFLSHYMLHSKALYGTCTARWPRHARRGCVLAVCSAGPAPLPRAQPSHGCRVPGTGIHPTPTYPPQLLT